MVTWSHQVKQLFLIPIPGVLTQTLGNIVGTWSAHWIMTVSVLFLRLCYSGITLYQEYENNLVVTWSALWSLTVCVLFLRLCYSGITLYQEYENNLGR